jgi:hypothetical protein
MDRRNRTWRTSSYSSSGNCVEVADYHGMVSVRDTEDRGHGPVHRYTTAEWRTFVADVKGRQSDH